MPGTGNCTGSRRAFGGSSPHRMCAQDVCLAPQEGQRFLPSALLAWPCWPFSWSALAGGNYRLRRKEPADKPLIANSLDMLPNIQYFSKTAWKRWG